MALNRNSILLFFLILATVFGHAFKPVAVRNKTLAGKSLNDSSVCDSLVKYAHKFLRKPYCYGSRAPSCFDCSGLVQYVFAHFGKELKGSSSELALEGKFVSFVHSKPGDLIFFNGRNENTENIGHVGIVTSGSGDSIFFIHASVQAGVIVSHTKEPYYNKRLLFVKRILIRELNGNQ